MTVLTPYGNLDYLQRSLASLLNDVRDLQAGRLKTPRDVRGAPTIDRWSFGLVPTSCIVGSIRGHHVLTDKSQIRTSQLILTDPENGWARTWSRYYRLGGPQR